MRGTDRLRAWSEGFSLHAGVVIADHGDGLDQAHGQIELAALPIARQVLRALLDRTILVDDAGTGDADERRYPYRC